MLFDDRLATVLQSPVGGDAAARTQYRQLLDLLGSRSDAPGKLTPARYRQLAAQADSLPAAERERILEAPAMLGRNPALLAFLGWQRLDQLNARIPDHERSRILREPGQRLRKPQFAAFLAEGDARPAAAAMAIAQLSEAEWLALIPQLPVMARGFLRHRRDLPGSARDLLANLGVGDMVLPQPDEVADTEATASPPPLTAAPQDRDGIRALLRRIEAFREGRTTPRAIPRLPLGDLADDAELAPITEFNVTIGTDGRISWAEGDAAPLVVGMRLGHAGPGTIAVLDDRAATALHQRLPLRAARLVIDAAPAISGEWRIDVEPVFTPASGQFAGYRGRIRKPLLAVVDAASAASDAPDTPEDRMRQVLHELRTPVNAIQGFAEIIQQQIFGPAPNAYRALAAAIAVDAAKLLAAFEEVDRLTRLDSRALDLAEGDADMREVVVETVRRLEGVLRPRNAAIDCEVSGSPFTTALAREELLNLTWRVLATLAGALAPGERIAARLVGDGALIWLECQLPASIAASGDPFASTPAERSSVLTAGMFGSGFSLRLARAEAQAAGGAFEIFDENLRLTLPGLTRDDARHSTATGDGAAA